MRLWGAPSGTRRRSRGCPARAPPRRSQQALGSRLHARVWRVCVGGGRRGGAWACASALGHPPNHPTHSTPPPTSAERLQRRLPLLLGKLPMQRGHRHLPRCQLGLCRGGRSVCVVAAAAAWRRGGRGKGTTGCRARGARAPRPRPALAPQAPRTLTSVLQPLLKVHEHKGSLDVQRMHGAPAQGGGAGGRAGERGAGGEGGGSGRGWASTARHTAPRDTPNARTHAAFACTRAQRTPPPPSHRSMSTLCWGAEQMQMWRSFGGMVGAASPLPNPPAEEVPGL